MGQKSKEWSSRDAARLRAVRAYLGHSQSECAFALRDLGATVGQGAVSRWETEKHVPHSDAVLAIERYCDAIELPHTGSNVRDTGSMIVGSGGDFDRLIGTLTGEPPLSDRQAAAIDAIIARIANGQSFSEGDRWVTEAALRFLGMLNEREAT